VLPASAGGAADVDNAAISASGANLLLRRLAKELATISAPQTLNFSKLD
jgi:hypothetical protein